jgi:ribosomal protein S18 acetylase RimI-like enzyme
VKRPPPAVQVDLAPSDEEVGELARRLRAFTERKAGRRLNARKFAVWLRAHDGALLGGVVGITYWDWLRVDQLWLDATVRGCGWGRCLLIAAEKIARRRGCRGAWLDTRAVQAPGFFRRLGYRRFGRLKELARTEGGRDWLFKDLTVRDAPLGRRRAQPGGGR